MEQNELIFSSSDWVKFQKWLELNYQSITWEGRYEEEFNSFWSLLFTHQISFKEITKRIHFLRKSVKSGPLASWFDWLEQKLFCFCFCYLNLSVSEIAQRSESNNIEVALTIRNFFVERYPHLEDQISDYCQVGNILLSKKNISFEEMKRKLGIDGEERGSLEDEILNGLEVTLFPEWIPLVNTMKVTFSKKNWGFGDLKKQVNFNTQWKFMKEVTMLFIMGGVLIFALKYFNKWYEDYLSDKVSLNEPNFHWLDKTLTYKADSTIQGEIDLSLSEIEKLEKKEIVTEEFRIEEDRFDVESDVMVASVENLPKNILTADLEESQYEESSKGGYRDSRFGVKEAYRVILNSVDPQAIRLKLNGLLGLYEAKQTDKVHPGQEIPGGLYYNLVVPIEKLKEFLSKVSTLEDSTLYISRSRKRPPNGTRHVFIWVKRI